MFHEYRQEISALKSSNAHFEKLFTKHNEIDDKVDEVENGRVHMEDLELEKLKKEKLKIKDEIHSMILEYKKQNG